MKTKLIAINVLVFLILIVSCETDQKRNNVQFKHEKLDCYVIKESRSLPDLIPTDSCAVQVAEIILKSFYGAQIEEQKPLRVHLCHDSVWIVKGSYVQDYNVRGGVGYIEIRKSDGKILDIYHER